MTVEELASLASSFQRRIDALPEGIDPSWHDRLGLGGWTAPIPEGDARRRVAGALFRRWCGPLPELQQLAHVAGTITLLSRPQLQARLAVLALSGRPGVLRSCVERRSRQAFEAALGPCFARLRDMGSSAAAASSEVAAWTPAQWAWVGYCELTRHRAWPSASLRRMVRLALPVDCGAAVRFAAAPAARVPVKRRLDSLESFFAGAAA